MRLFPLILLLVAAVARAQPPEVDRTLRTLDFEERRLGNAEDIPMHWTKATGAGLPHYVNGRLSDDRHRSGQFSFKFDLNGGSLIYRYEAGRIPVQRGAHYHIETFVQTTVLANARARLTASLADVDGRIIANTTRHSEAYSARTDDEPWHKLEIELAADSSDASSLILELELLQPHLYSPTTLGERALWPQDIHGSAWFDDVSVSQVPQVKMTTDRPGNIFRKGDTPRLQVVVNDRCTDDLAVQLVGRNARGKSVYQRSGALDMTTAEDLGPGRKKMALLLPELPPGWYEAALVMSSQGQFVGEQTLDLVLLADRGITRPDSRFGVDATQLPFDGWNELPDILPFLAAGRVKLAVWSSAGDIEQLDSASFDHLLERLGELGITPTACLLDLPPSVTDKLKPEEDKSKETSAAVGASAAAKPSWPRILKADPKDWQPQLAGLIARHANHLDRWQLGADGSDAFVTNKDMRTVYAAVYKQFSSLMQKPDLAMPWPAWYELEGELPATVALSVPSSVLPSQMPLYMQDLKSRDGHNLSLSLQLLDEAKYPPDLQIRDLAQRVIYALAADARRIDLPLPFTVRKSGDDVVKQPQEMLLILHTLISTLSNTTFRGKVPIAEGVEAFLFDRAGQGILVLWDRGSGGGGGGGGGTKHLPVNLGERPLYVGDVGGAFSGADQSGGYAFIKEIWIASPDEPGPILVRGGRIDTSGELRFGDGSEPAAELRLPIHSYEHTGDQPLGWRIFNGYVRPRSPGCYAMQLDTLSGSRWLVFEVTP